MAAALFLAGGVGAAVAVALPGIEGAFRASYPQAAGAPAQGGAGAGLYAGLDLARLGQAFAAQGLAVRERDDRLAVEGGSVFTLRDSAGEARVLVRFTVGPDADAAPAFLRMLLRGVSTIVPPAADPMLGVPAYADGGGRGDALVLGTLANVAYMIHVLPSRAGDGAAGQAADLARSLRAVLVPGDPRPPVPSLTLPAEVGARAGAPLQMAAPTGLVPRLRAEGAYVASTPGGPVLRPFGPGPVAVTATVVDGLGRVGQARATARAR